MSIEQLKTEVFGKRWMDESWHEVLKLIAGMIEAKFVGEIIEFLMGIDGEKEEFKNLFLAAECLGEVRNRSYINMIDKKLLAQLKYLVVHNQASEVPKAFGNWFLFLVNAQLVSKIAKIWINDAHTLSWLKTIAQSDNMHTGPQGAAMQAVKELAIGWKNDLDNFSIIKTLALSYRKPNVQQVALQSLAKYWKDEPSTLLILKKCAQSKESYLGVRSEAITELACIWKNKNKLFDFLCDRAVNDPDEKLREFAQKKLQEWNSK